ncbi:MAG: hypothetical protein ACRDOH_16680 [Streptosporangiaceae bacterium]
MILAKVRDPRLVTIRRGGTLTDSDHHLLDAYGAGESPEREALLTLARQSRERGWWQQYGEAVPEWFQTYVGLEAAPKTWRRTKEVRHGRGPGRCHVAQEHL